MEQTPTRTTLAVNGKNQMSAELRARLKRCSRNGMVQLTPKRSCAADGILSPSVATENNERESYTCAADIVGSPISLPALTHRDRHEELKFSTPSYCATELNNSYSVTEFKGLEQSTSDVDLANPCRDIGNICENSTQSASTLNACKTLCNNNQRSCLSDVVPVGEKEKENYGDTMLLHRRKLKRGEESPSEIVSMMAGIRCAQQLQPENSSESLSQLLVHKTDLEERIAVKEESLRKLRMVKMYRTKNDLTMLESLTAKWKSVCQEALEDLHRHATVEPRPSMTQLLQMLNVDPLMVGYDVTEESFI